MELNSIKVYKNRRSGSDSISRKNSDKKSNKSRSRSRFSNNSEYSSENEINYENKPHTATSHIAKMTASQNNAPLMKHIKLILKDGNESYDSENSDDKEELQTEIDIVRGQFDNPRKREAENG